MKKSLWVTAWFLLFIVIAPYILESVFQLTVSPGWVIYGIFMTASIFVILLHFDKDSHAEPKINSR